MSSHSWLNVWTRTSARMVNSMLAANRAATAALAPADRPLSGERVEERLAPAADLAEWDVHVDAEGELRVGDGVGFSKTLADADVTRFAAASGDTNPIHLDQDWAEETRFDGRIAHGTLAAGTISAALARLPGSVVYLSQDLEFQAPVRIGDRVTADVEVVEDLGGGRYRLRTTVTKGERVVIDGEAVVLIDDEP